MSYSAADKRAALEEVLQSTTFLRAEQLRNFLRYICEMEMAGRGGELNEYLIGVEALGRPPGYSTADDSSVRRRAHDLRLKLEEIYATEMAGAHIRIDLPKGSYVPRFLSAPAAAAREEAGAEAAAVPRPTGPRALALLAAFGTGALAAFAAFLWPRSAPSTAHPILAEAWGPFARPGANLLICLTAPPHIGILPYPDGPLPPMVSPHPSDRGLVEWYRQRYPMPVEDRLATHLTTGPIRLGEVLGLVAAIRTLDRLGADFQIVAERNVALPALLNRNLLLFGSPEFSFAAARLLERAALTVAYDPATRERMVRPLRASAPAGKVYIPTRDAQGGLAEVFGLVTVLPGESAGDGHPSQTVIISCTNSAGCQAAMEFFSSVSSLRALRERFQRENQPGFPPAYQVVVRCRVHAAQAISGEYESHVTLAP